MKASIVERFNRTLKNDVETIYAQWKLQMDRLATASRNRTTISNYRYAIYRCNSDNCQRTFKHGVQQRKDRHIPVIQSG